MPTLAIDPLASFARDIFQAAGAPPETARIVADSLVASNAAGHDSHGVIRIVQYLDMIERGDLNPAATPTLVRETGVTALVDGGWGFGQLVARFAVDVGIDKAAESGLAAVGLRNCGHVGRLGEWVQRAADRQQIGLAFCNGSRPGGLVAPFGGAGRMFGTNPIAAAIPLPDRPPIVLDFATSTVAEGKVRVARNNDQEIPAGSILDKQGRPSTRPADLYDDGVLLPAAGHKGSGLSLLVEVLGGLLTGAGWHGMEDYRQGNGVLFVILDVSSFRSFDEFAAEGRALAERIKAVPPAPGFDEVLLPGEPEVNTARRRASDGIALGETTWEQITDAARRLGVDAP